MLEQWCQFDGQWQLHKLSNCLIFVSAASFWDQRGKKPIHFISRRWSEGETKLACTSVIAQSSLPQITANDSLFLCRNNCTPAFQNTKAGLPLCIKWDLGIMQPHIYIIKWQTAIYLKLMDCFSLPSNHVHTRCQKHWCLTRGG